MGMGKALSGSDGYPTIYIYGWVNGIAGFWQGENLDGDAVWKQLGNKFPNGSLDPVWTCEGDGNIAGRAYLGFLGSGWQVYNYLLQRDLNPADNDNSPVELTKVG